MQLAILAVGIAVAVLVEVIISVCQSLAHARFEGMQEALRQITLAVTARCEHEGRPPPGDISKCIDDIQARVAEPLGAREKRRALSLHCRALGNAIGEASWRDGFEAGRRFDSAKGGEIDLGLSPGELKNICWLAHIGFENMMWNRDDHPFTFRKKAAADEAARAIERLERSIPKEKGDEDPYALSLNRQRMILERWPVGKVGSQAECRRLAGETSYVTETQAPIQLASDLEQAERLEKQQTGIMNCPS